MKKNIDTLVVYAPIIKSDILPLYPTERYLEVTKCKSEKTKREKYSVWKLLEKVVTEELKLDFANLQFTKTDNGKWICPEFCFSLSHTDNLVSVAVSPFLVGVDVELVRPIREEIGRKILTDSEAEYMRALPQTVRGRYLLECWVRKESIFKKEGQKALLPCSFRADTCPTQLHTLKYCGEEYIISVCTDEGNKTKFIYMEEI